MSKIADEILSYLGISDEIALAHVGVAHDENPPGRGSGRYAFGSGQNSYQHLNQAWLDKYNELIKSGMKEADVAREMGCYGPDGKPSTLRLRTVKSAAVNKVRAEKVTLVKKMRDEDGMTWQAIADALGFPNESSARSYYDGNSEANMLRGMQTAEQLKAILEKNPGKVVDVGDGVEKFIFGITKQRMDEALYILESEGYEIYTPKLNQPTNPGQKTTFKVLCPPGTEFDTARRPENMIPAEDFISYDDGNHIDPMYLYPSSVDSSRIKINYAEDGGSDRDGVVYIRRGVPDLDLGDSNYAQVRILVDGSHYIKGMAVNRDSNLFPDGIDLIFNTSKSNTKPMMTYDEDGNPTDKGVLKPIKSKEEDPDNPFGSTIKDIQKGGQYYYEDEDGNRVLGAINKRADAGDWEDMKKRLPSQFLAKQPENVVKNQLDLTIADKKAELNDILSISNSTLRKKELLDFAGSCDKAAVSLAAYPFAGQKYQVLVPCPSLKDDEVFAPNFKEGSEVALVRFPHAGPFEMPILKVNNQNKEGLRDILPNCHDAVGINYNVAKRLSGADYDGDFVIVIPNPRQKGLKNVDPDKDPYLKKLKDFDPHSEYAERPGMKYMKKGMVGNEMGKISNLITDMYVGGASMEEIVKATKHSMVVIDAYKHKLDYTKSFKDNDIEELKEKYQKHTDDDKYGGASSILSRAKSPDTVPLRKGGPRINDDGTVWYKTAPDSERFYIDKKTGKQSERRTDTTKMMTTDNAEKLMSVNRTPIERAYASFANEMKSMAKEARKIYKETKDIEYNKQTYLTYKNDMDTLLNAIDIAESNKNRERYATARANASIQQKMASWKSVHPEATRSEYSAQKKKISDREMKIARNEVGAKRSTISITDRQWDAIQNGGINKTNFERLLKYADREELKERATPRNGNALSSAKQSRIEALRQAGYTNEQIADQVGCSVTTVIKYARGKGE